VGRPQRRGKKRNCPVPGHPSVALLSHNREVPSPNLCWRPVIRMFFVVFPGPSSTGYQIMPQERAAPTGPSHQIAWPELLKAAINEAHLWSRAFLPRLGLDDRAVEVRVPAGSKLSPALGSMQRILGALSQGVKLAIHLQLVPRSRKRTSTPPHAFMA
jgi:hypothetical protein